MSGRAAGSKIDVIVTHTEQCDPRVLAEARVLLNEAFDGDFEDQDWHHALGGLHVMALADGRLIGHASLVMRRLLVGERSLRVGYVEAMAVRPAWQRQGIGAQLMAHIEELIDETCELGALSASDAGLSLYLARGWQPWEGPLFALTPIGTVPTPDEHGGVLVFTNNPIDVTAPLTCDWREGDVW